MIRAAGLVLLSGIIVASCQEDDLFLPFSRTLEADSEGVWSSDIVLTESSLMFRHNFGDLEWDVAFSYASFDIEYQPFTDFDFLGFEEDLHEDRFGGQVNLRYALSDRLTLLGGGGVYDGYPDYRRVWIANRYRQKYDHPDFGRIPGYEEPDPKGWNASAGARWEYLPLTGFAEVRLGYAADQTAPGYEDLVVGGEHLLLRGREHLQTKSLNVSSENVLTSWLRSLNEFALMHTTDRELRFTYQGSLNIALSPAWVVRGYGGMSTEEPRFDAFFFGAAVEFEPVRDLFFNVTGRYYEDTGEIEDSLLTSSAAPPLRSWELGAGLRYVFWRRAAVKVYVATFRTNYDPIRSGTAEFTHLYRDRKWGLAQIVCSWQF